jgi:hypothetical protein
MYATDLSGSGEPSIANGLGYFFDRGPLLATDRPSRPVGAAAGREGDFTGSAAKAVDLRTTVRVEESMMQRLHQLLGFDMQDLQGAHVSGEIPLTDVLINRVIEQRLASSESPVSAVVIEPSDNDCVVARVRMRARLVPPLTIDLRITQQPQLPDAPVLVLRWSLVGLGPLARLASPVLGLFDLLPRGIRVEGDLIGIDLAEMLRARGYGEALQYLKRLDIATRAGHVIVRFQAAIDSAESVTGKFPNPQTREPANPRTREPVNP